MSDTMKRKGNSYSIEGRHARVCVCVCVCVNSSRLHVQMGCTRTSMVTGILVWQCACLFLCLKLF